MQFKPIKQFNVILQQEYLEPTISWALRVVLALNVPLIVLPIWNGFSYEIIWAGFGGYMLSLIDYRGPHHRKIIIQFIEAILVFIAAMIGMYVGNSLWLSVVGIFFVGIFITLIRNWSDFGASIGVAIGFFYLFGISNPVDFPVSLHYGLYILVGAFWAILITVLSFLFTASNPLRRSVAKIWKENTEYLDALILRYIVGDASVTPFVITEKEMAIRQVIDRSTTLFARRQINTRLKTQHYDIMMDIRHTASLFGATLNAIHEELEVLNKNLKLTNDTVLNKTLSSVIQATARISIVIFTLRGEDLTMANIRVKRCEVAIRLFEKDCVDLLLSESERRSMNHLIASLYKSHYYLQKTILQIEEKMNFKRSDYLENYRLSFHHFLLGFKSRAFITSLRLMVNINSQQFKYALKIAIGLVLSVFIFKFFHIDHGYWIALTVIIVIQPYYGATRKKGIERTIGTVAGIILGGVIMLFPLSHMVVVSLLIVTSFLVAYFLRNNYKVGVFFVTIMLVVMMHISNTGGSWKLIGWRVVSTLIGAFIAILISYAFWPIWEKKRFPALFIRAINQNQLYLKQTIFRFNKQLPAGESWHKNRRLAEAANSDLFACVQRMYKEPQNIQQQVDLNFAKIGACIRMSREITSFALITNEIERTIFLDELNVFLNHINGIFEWIQKQVKESSIHYNLPDFKLTKESLQVHVFDSTEQMTFVKTEFEKIIFELETICALIKK